METKYESLKGLRSYDELSNIHKRYIKVSIMKGKKRKVTYNNIDTKKTGIKIRSHII